MACFMFLFFVLCSLFLVLGSWCFVLGAWCLVLGLGCSSSCWATKNSERGTKNEDASVFREDGRGREAVFVATIAQEFLPRHVDLGPTGGADTDDSTRTDAFDDEVRLKTDLNATAPQRHFASRLDNVDDGAFGCHVRWSIIPAQVLQRVLGCIHRGGDIFFEIGVKRFVHATEQGCGHGRATKLAILDGVDPGGHPAATDEGLVHCGLIAGGALHCVVVQPDVRDVEPGEHAIRCGFPGDTKQDGLATEGFFPFCGPRAFGDEFLNAEAFAPSPDSGGSIEGHLFLGRIAVYALLWFEAGDDRTLQILEVHFFELPDLALAKALAGLVF